ncbi:MAG: orotidine-5'-phosphate decarboxylase [Actinobacteria bacterium]|nr:MAG: orotidine-5'-phosphate decarboxylase [Actinomycetota bacterium]
MEEAVAEDRIIVALDAVDPGGVDRLCRQLAGRVRTLKVGLQLFLSQGPGVVSFLREAGFDVFLDLKLHDIPHQVALACAEIVAMGAGMLTVHASGGTAMLSAALDASRAAARQRGVECPKILGVTVLTSLEEKDLRRAGVERPVIDQVGVLAGLALDAGLDGVVASPHEVAALRRRFGDDFIAVTPGIRPGTGEGDDQRRTATPARAIEAGASYLVVGRPITQAADPVAALASIEKELRESQSC